MDRELSVHVKRLVKLIFAILLLLGVYLLAELVLPVMGRALKTLPGVVMPFLVAVVIAVLLEPVVRFFMTRVRLRRSLSALLALLTVGGGIFWLLYILISVTAREISSIYHQVLPYSGEYMNQFMGWLADWRIFFLSGEAPAVVSDALQESLLKLSTMAENAVNVLLNAMMQFLSALPGLAIFVMIVMVASFFFIKDREAVRNFLLNMLPEASRDTTREIIVNLFDKLFGFIRAYMTLVGITAILTMVGLKILGVEQVLTLGLLIGIADILPILGPGLIYIPWIVWAAVTGDTGMAIGLAVLYVIISAVRQFLEPKVVGDNIGLHPLATLIALYVGLRLGGAVGMLLGPVVIVVVVALYQEGLLERFDWRKRGERGRQAAE
ncbi:MAG: sporulation integral membrane protein YtvI [Syntrophomonadaceae bacterium]|nr:sporulation integral membrane protein YtvI [Syntrophomonadaceae bacterium]